MGPIGGMFPPEGMAEAPSDFGSYGGQVFTVNQGGVDYPGTDADSHIGRIDPATGQVSRFCDLPRIEPNVTSGWPSQGTFGPPGSPFAGKFYAAAAHSHTVYQVTPDAKCVPFATFANFSPAFIAFTPDGKTMIVSGFVGEAYSRNGALMRVSPTGSIDPEPLMRYVGVALKALFVLAVCCPARLSAGDTLSPELQRLMKRLLAPPTITPQPGFTAKLIVAPGNQFYDAFYVSPRGPNEIWVSDDAGPIGTGQIVSVDRLGATRVLVPGSGSGDIIGFDVAPAGFGKFGGQIFTLSQGGPESDGMYINALIERADPAANFAISTFCTLPPLRDGRKATVPYAARFGPADSPYANRLFAVVAGNHTVYEMTADSACKPFVTFDDPVRTPNYIVFTPDHKQMLVAVTPGDLYSDRDKVVLQTGSNKGSMGLVGAPGMLLSIAPDGKIAQKPYLEGSFTGPEFAPPGFGAYAGQMFFTRKTAPSGFMPPLGQPHLATASLFRRTPEGKEELVAAGFVGPRIRFIDDKTLWVADHNGDMVTGRREWPDGRLCTRRQLSPEYATHAGRHRYTESHRRSAHPGSGHR